jgi:hypothetical protein
VILIELGVSASRSEDSVPPSSTVSFGNVVEVEVADDDGANFRH